MKSYVITIMDMPESVKAAERCIASGADYGLDIKMWSAITPRDNPFKLLEEKNIPLEGFKEKYSRMERCVSAFLSHHSLWEEACRIDEDVLIFEHDAVVAGNISEFTPFKGILSYGHPSYGAYNTPNAIGVGPLVSKKYLPGAHAYRINQMAANALIDTAKNFAKPTDVFINNQFFPFIEEFYPWPVNVDDSFTTIQREEGCRAKHNWNKNYEII